MEHKYRSIIKAVSWRLTGSIDTFIVSFVITGKPVLALSISGVEVFTKIGLFYFHERAWNRIKFGRKEMTEPDYQI
jgi:Predicted membrane protein